MTLKKALIELIAEKPELKKHIEPLLQKTARKIHIGNPHLDRAATKALQSGSFKPKARNKGDINSAILSGAFYAKKLQKDMFIYLGNSYMSSVWRVSYKANDYLDPINNTGSMIYLITPEWEVFTHKLRRTL